MIGAAGGILTYFYPSASIYIALYTSTLSGIINISNGGSVRETIINTAINTGLALLPGLNNKSTMTQKFVAIVFDSYSTTHLSGVGTELLDKGISKTGEIVTSKKKLFIQKNKPKVVPKNISEFKKINKEREEWNFVLKQIETNLKNKYCKN